MKELKKDPEASTILIDISCPDLHYTTADNIIIFPENTEEEVQELAEIQGYELDRGIAFQGPKAPFPTPCTIREALLKYCDITSLVKKKFLKDLAYYAQSQEEKEALTTLASLKGKSQFVTRVQDAYLHVTDLFRMFPSVRVPIGDLLQLMGRIQPRYFTIASSSLARPDVLQIVLSVQKTVTLDGHVKKGLCSGYLQHMFHTAVYKTVNVMFKASSFRLPSSPVPLIFICNGAGIAPFRGWIQELRLISSCRYPNVMLFFGCQAKKSHFIFRCEVDEAIIPSNAVVALPYEYIPERSPVEPVLTKVFCAFSRDQPAKVYIQSALTANEEMVWDLISSKGASLFVCG
jgi:NADPH-ferrihemoprotein reductase